MSIFKYYNEAWLKMKYIRMGRVQNSETNMHAQWFPKLTTFTSVLPNRVRQLLFLCYFYYNIDGVYIKQTYAFSRQMKALEKAGHSDSRKFVRLFCSRRRNEGRRFRWHCIKFFPTRIFRASQCRKHINDQQFDLSFS